MSTSFEWNPEELYAHPGETLYKHLVNTANRMRMLVEQSGASVPQRDLAWIGGFCHDIGKATEDFQEYLHCGVDGRTWRGDPKHKSHSKLGAQLCLIMGEQLLTARNELTKSNKLDLWLVALAIRSHHGRLHDFNASSFQLVGYNENGEDRQLLTHQIDRLRRPQFDQLLLLPDLKTDFSPQKIIEMLLDDERWENWYVDDYHFEKLLRTEINLRAWTFLKLVFGALLQADKEQNLRGDFPRRSFQAERTKQFVAEFVPQNEIDQIRHQLFKQCTEYADQVDLTSTHVHQLTLPTGAGKTLSGLQVASILRKRLEANGKQPRIIYTLPFISIIEQNFEVFSEVFGERSGDFLLAHHHLANLDFRAKGQELDGVEAAFKIEGWESEIIVTTFHQLFEALFGTANASNRKMAALQDAIVILDEPQALPIHFFPLIRAGLQAMIRELGWHVVLMTATPPLLFEKNNPLCKQIVNDFQQVFEQFNRYYLIDKRNEISTTTQLMDALVQEWHAGAHRILIVANTVNSSREIYDGVKEFCEANHITTYYLSTEVLPLHRKQKINLIGKAEPMIVVSTQLIEAGVDISLDIVFRDFAPMPSLIQSAGRCRRHDWQECSGRVIVMKLHDEKGNPFSGKIYDPLMLSRTEDILKSCSENKIWPLIQEYYEQIQAAISQEVSIELVKKLAKLQLSIVDERFDLIDPLGPRRDMLILYDETAQTLFVKWREFGIQMKENVEYNKRFELKSERRKIWRKLVNYLITPYEYRISKELLQRYPEGLIVVDQDIEKYYSEEIGLIPLKKGGKYVTGTNFG